MTKEEFLKYLAKVPAGAQVQPEVHLDFYDNDGKQTRCCSGHQARVTITERGGVYSIEFKADMEDDPTGEEMVDAAVDRILAASAAKQSVKQ